MKSIILAAVGSMLFTGCNAWYRGDVTLEQAVQDYRECSYEAKKAVIPLRDPMIAGMTQADLIRDCMSLRGYHLCPKNKLPKSFHVQNVEPFILVAGR